MAFVSLPLEHSLSAQEGANCALTETMEAFKPSSSYNSSPLGDVTQLQAKKQSSKNGHSCTGAQGPVGPVGPQGPVGEAGPPGRAEVSLAYGSFSTQLSSTVTSGGAIPFNATDSSHHVSLRNNGVIHVEFPGVYLVTFAVQQAPDSTGTNAGRVALHLNGSSLSGTNVSLTATTSLLTTVSTIIPITTAPATLQVVNNDSTNSLSLGSNTLGYDTVGLITVVRLHDLSS